MVKEKEKIKEKVATGRRKTAVASVRLREGSGKFKVNNRGFEEYFSSRISRELILAPLKLVGSEGKFDFLIRVKGGGPQAQSEAVRLGIARALEKDDETLRQDLKSNRFLTRDSRKKERKKYGQPGARKRFQFSKR